MKKKKIFLSFIVGVFLALTLIFVLDKLGLPDIVHKQNLKGLIEEIDVMSFDCSDFNNSYVKIKGKTVEVTELKINKLSFKCMKENLKNKNILKISMSSGGQAITGDAFGDYIKKNNISVHVEYYCASACVDLLVYSNNSSICSQSIIGVHQSGIISDNFLSQLFYKHAFDLSSKRTISTYIENGVKSEHITKAIEETVFSDIYIIPANDLLKYNYIDKVIEC
jgi:hypothetical protein